MEIGIKLKRARKEKGITQEQAAEALGVSRQTVSNWENNKSYPDIVSVIKMSDLYSVSLDHLLKDKEEKAMNQTYQEFLEESTNTVKAKRKLGTVILTAAYFLVWIASMTLFWQEREPVISELAVILRWILLPSFLLVTTVTVSKTDYWGKGKWLCVLGAAVMFLTVPETHFTEEAGMIKYTFRFPNFTYMAAGIFVALCGIGIGTVWRRRAKEGSKETE
ncbi:MAG: helix-turn-helix domain-containing protein [bacterium]|nr:helix-turn-helix domain-containing protein [bacterium]